MKKIALMGAIMGSLSWVARRPPTVPVPQVRTLLVDEIRPPVAEPTDKTPRLATSSTEVKKQRQAAQKRKQDRGYK